MQSSSAAPIAGSLIGLFVATTPRFAAAEPDDAPIQPKAGYADARPNAHVVAATDTAGGQPDAAPTKSGTEAAQLATMARQLFDKARGLAKKGQYGEACPKFEQSYEMDPGIGTLFNLADCWEHMGRTASAWAKFRQVASEAARTHQDDRERLALKRAHALLLKLSKVVVRVTSVEPEMEVLRDGVPLARADLDQPIPIDPGQHSFEARAPGRKAWRAMVSVPPGGQAIEVRVPTLADAEQPPATPTASAPSTNPMVPATAIDAVPAQSSIPATAPSPRSPLQVNPLSSTEPRFEHSSQSPQRTMSYVAGGVGIVALVAGTFFGLRVRSKNEEADAICPTSRRCTEQDQADLDRVNDAARSARTMAFVSFGVGGAALGTAVALYLSAPSSGSHAWQLTPTMHSGALGAALQGGF